MAKRIVVGVTGASGSVYAYQLIRNLIALGIKTDVIFTQAGEEVFRYECGFGPEDLPNEVSLHANDHLFSSLASGSVRTDGMVIVPCSMNTLGLIASGIGDHLLSRAAQVTLKERRPLIVVPREMPFNMIQLENMMRLAKAGGVVMAAAPGFYHKPVSIDDLVNHVVGRILDQLNIDHELYRKWDGG